MADDAGGAVDPLLGARVGSFVITRQLGAGGMGAVYLGVHPAIGSKVAIKFLHATLSEDAAIVRRFQAEARAANLASNEHVLRVLDLGHLPGRGHYLVMEYVEGQTLAAMIGRQPQPLELAAEILVQLCRALGPAHRLAVVHRDLKPENILVSDQQGRPFVRVADFGIAKLRDGAALDAGGGTTQAGLLLGTPEYMSPEQCEGREVDPRADLYALGVLAFQLVTGRLPFERESPVRVMIAQLREAPPRPSSLRPDLPRAWDALILRALEKDPAARFPHVEALAAAVTAARDQPQHHAAHQPRPASTPVEVELAPGAPCAALQAVHLSRSGAVVCYGGVPPPLLSRLKLRVPTPAGIATVEAEVVRHVGDAEARGWNIDPGFAVAFVSPREPPHRPAPRDVTAAGRSQVPGAAADGDHAQRLALDAEAGNFRGVARALMGGLPRALVAEAHAKSLRAHPERAAQVEALMARARAERARGKLDAAACALDEALALDPLNLTLHDARTRLAGQVP